MSCFTREKLEECGFRGWLTPAQLYRDGASNAIPTDPGVYVVILPDQGPEMPQFVNPGTGGRFKDRDPNVPITAPAVPQPRRRGRQPKPLDQAWVPGAEVVYVGQTTRPLRTRISELADFGHGEPVAHWGGRYMWQIADAQTRLLIAWCPTPALEPEEVERWLLVKFKSKHGQKNLPFANLKGHGSGEGTRLPNCNCD